MKTADTSAYLLLRILFSDAKHYGMTYGIAINHGLGKTFTALEFMRENEDVFYVKCNENMTRKDLLMSILTTLGASDIQKSVPQMILQCTYMLQKKAEVLIIVDDADVLSDSVLQQLVLLLNQINECGIVIMGNDLLRTRILDGMAKDETGFDEIFKSIGRRFITLGSLGPKDVELVCRANGVSDDEHIDAIKECRNLHDVMDRIRDFKSTQE